MLSFLISAKKRRLVKRLFSTAVAMSNSVEDVVTEFEAVKLRNIFRVFSRLKVCMHKSTCKLDGTCKHSLSNKQNIESCEFFVDLTYLI